MSSAPQPPVAPVPPPSPNRLYRSRADRILGGVAAGVATQLNLDPSLVRVGWVLLAVVTGGIFGLIYVVMWVIVPEEPGGATWTAGYPPPGPGAIPGWQPPATAGAPTTGQPAVTGEPAPAGATAGGPGEPGASGFTGAPAPWAAPPTPPAGGQVPNVASVVIGLVLIIAGGIFLLEQVFPQLDLGSFWPVVPIVIGAALLYAALRPRRGG